MVEGDVLRIVWREELSIQNKDLESYPYRREEIITFGVQLVIETVGVYRHSDSKIFPEIEDNGCGVGKSCELNVQLKCAVIFLVCRRNIFYPQQRAGNSLRYQPQ